jgi:hypothetical protein
VLEILDTFFFCFHTLLIVFVLVGWAWRRTRRAHLVLVLLTALSWCVLGIRYGFGYCPCTDWHWQVRERLGHYDMPASYIKFLIDTATGRDAPAQIVDTAVILGLVTALAFSMALNIRDWRKNRRQPHDR